MPELRLRCLTTCFSNSGDGYLLSKSFQRCGTLTLNLIKALSMRSLFSFEELDFLTQHWVKPTTPSALDFCSIQGNQLWPRIPSSLPPSIPPPKIDQILLELKRWWWWWCWEKTKIKTHTNNSLTQLMIIMLSNNFRPLNHWIIIIMCSLEILIDHESYTCVITHECIMHPKQAPPS